MRKSGKRPEAFGTFAAEIAALRDFAAKGEEAYSPRQLIDRLPFVKLDEGVRTRLKQFVHADYFEKSNILHLSSTLTAQANCLDEAMQRCDELWSTPAPDEQVMKALDALEACAHATVEALERWPRGIVLP